MMELFTVNIVWSGIFPDHEAVSGVHSPQDRAQHVQHPPAKVMTILKIPH